MPDQLVGVSAGSVNAALFAWNGGIDGLHRMEAIWRGIKRRDLMRVHPGRLALAVAGRQSSFLDNRHGRSFLHRHLGQRLLEHAPTPLALVATDLSTGRRSPSPPATPPRQCWPAARFRACTHRSTSRGAPSSTGASWPTCHSTSHWAWEPRLPSCCRCPRSPPTTHPPEPSTSCSAPARWAWRRMVAPCCAGRHQGWWSSRSTPPTSLTTFAVGRSADMIEAGYAAAGTWLRA